MPHDPFELLGVPPCASHAQIRRAFRRLAPRHHPDHNPGDTDAAERFKRLVRAYRAALAGRRAPEPAAPAGPRPDRYGCAACGDTFPFPETCPRCARPLHDRQRTRAAAPSDPRVEAWVRRMEGKPALAPSAERIPAPGLVSAGFLGAAALSWSLGPIGPAVLFAGFAVYVAAVEGHRIATGDLR